MRKGLERTAAVAAIALVGGLTIGGGPAAARDGFPSASVDVRELVAGTAQQLAFSVSNPQVGVNPAGAPPVSVAPIDWVSIGPLEIPEEAAGTFYFSTGESAGWDVEVFGDQIVFSGGEIDPGETATFDVTAELPPLDEDSEVEWFVDTATDGTGTTVTPADPAGTGALTSLVRILTIDSVRVVAPEGAVDGTATSGQHVTVGSRLTNHSSRALTVAAAVAGAAGDVLRPHPATETVAAGESVQVERSFVLGSAAERTFDATATASGAEALPLRSDPVRTAAAPLFSYEQGSLRPSTGAPGATVSPTVELEKRGSQAVAFDELRLLLSRDGDEVVTTSSDVSLPAGEVTDFRIEFDPVVLPGSPGGDEVTAWDAEVAGAATDENGAEHAVELAAGTIVVDGRAPVVAPELIPPSGRAGPGGPAATEGDLMTIAGSIGQGAHEPGAVVLSCTLVVAAAGSSGGAGATLARVPVPAPSCLSSDEGIRGEVEVPDTTAERAVAWVEISARDAAGNAASGASDALPVDNDVPAIVAASTGCPPVPSGCEPSRSIHLTFSEPLRGAFAASDFTVPDRAVSNVVAPCSGAFCERAVLTLDRAPGPNATPNVAYRARSGAPDDGVGHGLASATIVASDGIAPDPPVLAAVSQEVPGPSGELVDDMAAPVGGAFFTNDLSPAFLVRGLAQGDHATVARDSNSTGAYEKGVDEVLADCAASGVTAHCGGTRALGQPQTPMLVVARDPAGNVTGAVAGEVRLDQTAPAVFSFRSANGRSIVELTEPLRSGRDDPADWRVFAVTDGARRAVVPAQVEGEGAERTLHVFTSSTPSGVDYSFDGPPHLRYRDRAGNRLRDFTFGEGAGAIGHDALTIEVSPGRQSRPFGSVHIVRARVRDPWGLGVEGLEVDVLITSGPGATRDADGDATTPAGYAGECTTTRDGCSMTLSSPVAGTDHLLAWIDFDSDDLPDEARRSPSHGSSASVVWTDPADEPPPSPSPSPNPGPTSSPEPPPRATHPAGLTIEASAGRVTVGDDVTVWGSVASVDECKSRRPVEIEVSTPRGPVREVVQTADDGTWRFVHRPTANVSYAARVPAAERCAGAESTSVVVGVGPRLRLDATRRPVAGSCVRLEGTIHPRRVWGDVLVQKRVGPDWARAATVPVQRSRFSLPVCFREGGRNVFRAVWSGDAVHARGSSRPLVLRVRDRAGT